jgi:alpha-tubulin suppressor-like RCC1 family protein/endonuclease/exonuclease/phosphatase family metal-dependent hydrolase
MKAHVALIALLASLLSPVLLAGPSSADVALGGVSATALGSADDPLDLAGSERRRGGAESVSAGGEHSCRLPGDGTLWCWGRNSFGQLGDGHVGTQTPTAQRVGSGSRWKNVSSGGATTCGIKGGGKLYCWGLNHRGQIGDGTDKVRSKPQRVAGQNKRWASVSSSWYNTCGITTNGRLWCWGDNAAGQLADGSTKTHKKPVKVRGKRWESVSVGSRFVCATKADHSLYCWGGNLFGQLGNGTFGGRNKPTRVGAASNWSEVSTSWTHTCARNTSGQAYCWGRNTSGQLGDGTTTTSAAPRLVSGGQKVVDIATTEGASCLLADGGRAWCWGNNAYGVFGDAARPWSAVPVSGPADLRELDGGWRHICAVASTGNPTCWGENDRGQLGNGSTTPSAMPVEVQPAPAADPAGATVFRLATVNMLGNNHSRPYAHDDRYGPASMRGGWLADAVDALNVDVVGLQEGSADHLAHLLKSTRGKWDAYPRPADGELAVEAPLMWRKSVWEATEETTISTQFITKTLARPVLKLRHRVTGKEIYVMNVHNAPWEYQRKRDRATRVQIAKLQELEATGLPVFFIGDMNEKRTLLCKVLEKTDLVSVAGGAYDDATGRCTNPPQRMRVDWIFGSPQATYSGFEMNRHPLLTLTTDHSMALVGVRLP